MPGASSPLRVLDMDHTWYLHGTYMRDKDSTVQRGARLCFAHTGQGLVKDYWTEGGRDGNLNDPPMFPERLP